MLWNSISVQLAKEKMRQNNYAQAEEILHRALISPENLGEGKLEGTKDNHLYYHLGLCAQAQGKEDEAAAFFRLATEGVGEPAGAV